VGVSLTGAHCGVDLFILLFWGLLICLRGHVKVCCMPQIAQTCECGSRKGCLYGLPWPAGHLSLGSTFIFHGARGAPGQDNESSVHSQSINPPNEAVHLVLVKSRAFGLARIVLSRDNGQLSVPVWFDLAEK